MSILFSLETDVEFDFDYEKLIEEVVEECLDFVKCPYESEINITFVDDNEMKNINLNYRETNKTTDVLSFPLVSYKEAGNFDFLENSSLDNFNPESGELLLGDIVISTNRVIYQAKEYGHSLKRELAFLVAHSMFHLFGYDHMDETESKIMEQKQEAVLKNLNIYR